MEKENNPMNEAVYYVIYRFDRKAKFDIENPKNIIAIHRSGSLFFTDPHVRKKKKYVYQITAVDRLHNESKPSEARIFKYRKKYLKKYPIKIIIQEFIEYENECGIFYLRNPNNKSGKISSITLKRFLNVTGDGRSTLKELVNKDNRAKLYLDLLSEIHLNKLNDIPKNNEIVKLSVIGNHSKGTQFICGGHLISKKIEEIFDKLSNAIPGWFYGRIDLKYNTFEELENGINFKILEINGILAEPTHIYDTSQSNYLKALKEMRVHWKQLYKIARINHDEKNIPYRSTIGLLKDVKKLKKYTKNIVKLNKI